MSRRSTIVKVFRCLADGKSSEWKRALEEANNQLGTIPANDCHSILIALNKSIETKIHPVRVASLAGNLIQRILSSSDTALRTKAGTLGLVTRLGIDWKSHLPQNSGILPEFIDQFRKIAIQTHSGVDVQSIGYLCDAAVYFDMYSAEFTSLIEERILADSSSFPVLATVQIAEYLSRASCNSKNVWRNIVDRVLFDLYHFTPQNLNQILSSFVRVGFTSSVLVERVAQILSRKTELMRLCDCISLCESICLLSNERVDLTDFAKAIQRRSVVLMVTSPKRVSVTDIQRLSDSMKRILISQSRPFVYLTEPNQFI